MKRMYIRKTLRDNYEIRTAKYHDFIGSHAYIIKSMMPFLLYLFSQLKKIA